MITTENGGNTEVVPYRNEESAISSPRLSTSPSSMVVSTYGKTRSIDWNLSAALFIAKADNLPGLSYDEYMKTIE